MSWGLLPQHTYTREHTHTHTFNIYHTALGHTHSKSHCPERREKGWEWEGCFHGDQGDRRKKGSASRPSLRRWWLSLSWGKTASSHNARDKSEGESDQQPCTPPLLWPLWASVVSLRHLALASERHYANNLKGSSPRLCVFCANPRAREDFTFQLPFQP